MEKLDKITSEQLARNGIVSLADRPNLPSTYGEGGLSAQQLKARFDKLSGLINGLLTDVVKILGGEDVNGKPASKYISFPLAPLESVYDLIQAVQGTAVENKIFADLMKVKKSASDSTLINLQAHLNNIITHINTSDQDIEGLEEAIADINEDLDVLNAWKTAYDTAIQWLSQNRLQIQMQTDDDLEDVVATKSLVDAIKQNYNNITATQSVITYLTGQVSNAVETAEEALRIAQGASSGKSFEDYEDMIEYLNEASATAHKDGSVFLIATVDVPDCYVYQVLEEAEEYTYTTDEQFIEDMRSGDAVCGYYDIRQLETGKVDLEDYQKKQDNTLATESKNIVGAINELESKTDTTNSVVSSLINDVTAIQGKIPSVATPQNPLVAYSQLPVVEQIYSPTSTGAQSGVAVAQAIAGIEVSKNNIIERGSSVPTANADAPDLFATITINGRLFYKLKVSDSSYGYVQVARKSDVDAVEEAIPQNTSDLINDSGFVTKSVDDLTNYYLKSNTYTKTEVQELIAQIKTTHYVFPPSNELPTPTAELEFNNSKAIYMIQGDSYYTEYICVVKESVYSWETIGTTEVNVPVKSISAGGTALTPDAQGNWNIPIASNSHAGLFLTSGGAGIHVGSTGIAQIKSASNSDLENKISNYTPIVPANLDKAVQEGLGNNSLTMSAQYQSNARNFINCTLVNKHNGWGDL